MLVKPSKIGTIMPRDHYAKSHVIMQLSLVFMAKRVCKQQVASGSGMWAILPQRPKEADYGNDHGEQPLQVTEQNGNAKGNAEL